MKPFLMSKNIEASILEILDKTLYAYNEGCTGSSCQFTVNGKENAVQKLREFFEIQVKEATKGSQQ